MWYMILGTDAPNQQENRQRLRPMHLKRLTELHEQKRLLVAGPTPLPDSDSEVSGSLIIIDFPSLDAAEEWVKEDVYAVNGVYDEVLIRPFKQALP